MPASCKRWTLVALLIALVFSAFLMLKGCSPVTTNAVGMTFIGYTNPPGNPLQFALFSVSNQVSYDIKWRGSWVEIEGQPDHKAETMNSALPGFTRKPILEGGGSLQMAIGQPSLDSENGRWRFALSYVRYKWQERWMDFSLRHKLSPGLNRVFFLDAQRIFNPSNNVTVTTEWLTK